MPRSPVVPPPANLGDQLRAAGLALPKGTSERRALTVALSIINRSLNSAGIGQARRDKLRALREELVVHERGPAKIVPGGLPSLGKRR